MWGHPVRLRLGAKVLDPATARRLWTVSTDLTGVNYEF